jgi:hypothetical protein
VLLPFERHLTQEGSRLLKSVTKQVIELGRKNSEINVIKNPQNHDPTFVSDPIKELLLKYSNQQGDNRTINGYDGNEKMVKKARHGSNRFSKAGLRNKSKQGISKQNHSPVYE